jgi:hypothetical protein
LDSKTRYLKVLSDTINYLIIDKKLSILSYERPVQRQEWQCNAKKEILISIARRYREKQSS